MSRTVKTYIVEGAGHVTLLYMGTQGQDWVQWGYAFHDAEGTLLDQREDLFRPVSERGDIDKAASAVFQLLGAAADAHDNAHYRGVPDSRSEMFAPDAMAWAFIYAEEIAEASYDIGPGQRVEISGLSL